MNRALTFIRLGALAVFFAMLVAKYAYGFDQLRFWTLIPAAIWIAAGMAQRSNAKKAEAGDNG